MDTPVIAKLTPQRQSMDLLQPDSKPVETYHLRRPDDQRMPTTFDGQQNIGAPLSRREPPVSVVAAIKTGQPTPQATDAVTARPQSKQR